MTVSGSTGQSYTLMISTDLVSWTPAFVFVLTNSTAVISDPAASNFVRRFYRLGR
jgi:hypothetical protein